MLFLNDNIALNFFALRFFSVDIFFCYDFITDFNVMFDGNAFPFCFVVFLE